MRENTNAVFNLQINMEATGARICDLLKQSGFSREEVMESLGLSTAQTFWKWRHGRSIPSTDNLMRLSVLLGVSVDSLLVVPGRGKAEALMHPKYSHEVQAAGLKASALLEEKATPDENHRREERTGRDHSDDCDALPVLFWQSRKTVLLYNCVCP